MFDFVSRTTTGDVPGTPPFDAQRSVDGERGIEILRGVPVSSEGLDLEVRSKVLGVYDKGLSTFFLPSSSDRWFGGGGADMSRRLHDSRGGTQPRRRKDG